jgi:HK97 family phage prohead protease
MENRAYSVLHVKALDEDDEARIIRGVATTPTPDRVGDVVEPQGVKFQNPMPLLWQHRADMPVGTVKFNKPTKDGITFEARFAKAEKSQTLKDRIDEAWESVKLGLVSAVSIGFRSLEHAVMNDGGYRFIRSEVYELSLVTIPAQAEAVITAIKNFDRAALASAGTARGESEPAACSSGQKKHVTVELIPRRRTQIQITPR